MSRTNQTPPDPQDLLRWSYSQHFHAESRGEEVIEDLLTLCTRPTQRKMLSAQVKDEQRHVALYRSITDRVGLDTTADGFARGYVDLVKRQSTLSEKIFCFQILTETVSAAFCEWRLSQPQDLPFRVLDLEVLADEQRHLKMGHCLLSICERDELEGSLDPERRRILLHSMATICNTTLNRGSSVAAANLARRISRNLIREVKQASLTA